MNFQKINLCTIKHEYLDYCSDNLVFLPVSEPGCYQRRDIPGEPIWTIHQRRLLGSIDKWLADYLDAICEINEDQINKTISRHENTFYHGRVSSCELRRSLFPCTIRLSCWELAEVLPVASQRWWIVPCCPSWPKSLQYGFVRLRKRKNQ